MLNTRSHGLPKDAMSAFLSWWHGLNRESPSGQARADSAVLRRAGSLTAVVCTPAYQRVYQAMASADRGGGWPAYQQDRIAAFVALSAHLKAGSQMTLPRAMSAPKGVDERNPVSELRFLRLLDAPDIESLFNGLRRVLPLIDNQVDPASLADDVFFWGDRVKKRWAYEYAWPKKAGA